MKERIQKVLARAGIASRRQIEAMIEDGRIEINGRVAKLGDKIALTETVLLDGRPIKLAEPEQTRVIAYNKPVGQICTRDDPEGRDTVFQHLPSLKTGRWISVGRLDINTSGLLLFTNNGDLANALMHPSAQLAREYAVRVLGKPSSDTLKKLTHGVKLDDGLARFEHIVDSGGEGANHWYHVVVMEGRNRLVRRLWESQGHTVSRLMRVRFGPIVLQEDHRAGRIRELQGKVLQKLLSSSG